MKFPRHLSTEIRDFIRSILMVKPQQRMGLKEALSHEWMKKYAEWFFFQINIFIKMSIKIIFETSFYHSFNFFPLSKKGQ